jgi:hypothetical protein
MGVAGPRRVWRGALEGVARLAFWPLAVLWASLRFLPVRVPDLKRLTRRDEFRLAESRAAASLDQHFSRIEERTPWLDRAGRWVCDACLTSLGSPPVSLEWNPQSVRCKREVTVVYGTDGNLDDRLAELRDVLSATGWTIDDHMVLFGVTLGESLMWPFAWSAPDGLSPSPSLAITPALMLDMGVGWASRGRPPGLKTSRETSRSGDPRIATVLYQPVDVGGTSVDRLASEALARHQHAIAIRIGEDYYYNYNVNAKPDRLRKRLLPRWPRER